MIIAFIYACTWIQLMFSKGSKLVIAHSLECVFHTKCAFILVEMCEGHALHWWWAFTPPVWCELGGFSCYSVYNVGMVSYHNIILD